MLALRRRICERERAALKRVVTAFVCVRLLGEGER